MRSLHVVCVPQCIAQHLSFPQLCDHIAYLPHVCARKILAPQYMPLCLNMDQVDCFWDTCVPCSAWRLCPRHGGHTTDYLACYHWVLRRAAVQADDCNATTIQQVQRNGEQM